jgi:hypothetical protein
MTTTLDLPPIVRTVMLPGRSGRIECWGVRTKDGEWGFDRTEEEGGNTPWEIFHLPSVADGSYTMPVTTSGTRKGCQRIVASGLAADLLAVAKCTHPAGQRGQRTDHGTYDWVYETCGACRGVRPAWNDHEDGQGWSADR